jgi:hypothetical protein
MKFAECGTDAPEPQAGEARGAGIPAPELMLIMRIGPLPNPLKPDIHCVRAHWIRVSQRENARGVLA